MFKKKLLDKLGKQELEELEELIVEERISQEVRKRLENYKKGRHVCPVCNGEIEKGEEIVLEFGERNLRKKAYFDGYDCLQYFTSKMKK